MIAKEKRHYMNRNCPECGVLHWFRSKAHLKCLRIQERREAKLPRRGGEDIPPGGWRAQPVNA